MLKFMGSKVWILAFFRAIRPLAANKRFSLVQRQAAVGEALAHFRPEMCSQVRCGMGRLA